MKKIAVLVLTVSLFSIAASAQGIARLANWEAKEYMKEQKAKETAALDKAVEQQKNSLNVLAKQLDKFVYGERSYNYEVRQALERLLGKSLHEVDFVLNLGQYAMLSHHWNGGEMEFNNRYHVAIGQGSEVSYYEVVVGEYQGYSSRKVIYAKKMDVTSKSGTVLSFKQLLKHSTYKENQAQETQDNEGYWNILNVVVFDSYK